MAESLFDPSPFLEIISKANVGILSETSIGEFEWTLPVKEILETRDHVYSPEFSFSSSTWTFMLSTNNNMLKGISISLKNIDLDSKKCVTFKVCKITEGILFFSSEEYHIFEASEDISRPCHFVFRSPLYDDTKTCSHLTIGIKLKEIVPHDDDPYTLHELRRKHTEILRQNYKDLLLSGEDHDLILKVKEQEFKVHRNIMKCRCPVFKSMLFHEMVEKNSGVVEIPDCDPCAFEQFLFYIYTGDFDTINESVMLGLYYIADKYDMSSVKEKCCEFIKKSLSARNICSVITLAVKHCDTALLKCATKYFIENAKQILVTVEWQSFMKENPSQANAFFLKTIENCPCHLPKKRKKN